MEKDVVLDEKIIDKKIKELSKGYSKNEKYVLLLFRICLDFNINNCDEEILKFLEK